jgi:hypothetical protein
VTSRLRVREFVVEDLGYRSLEDFAACDACVALVIVGDKKGLFLRSLETLRVGGRQMEGEELFVVALPIALLQREFFRNWTGEVLPVQERGEN